MRHRIGMILAVVMAGVLFFPGSWGYLRLLRFPAAAGQLSQLPSSGGSLFSDRHALIELAAIAGTGLLAGILVAAPRISPLAAGLPGLLLTGWTGFYLVSTRQAVDLIPLRSDPFGAGFEAMLLNGVLGAAGLAMLVPLCVPSRWRARVSQEEAAAEAAEAGEFISGLGGTTEPVARPADQPTKLTPVAVGTAAPTRSVAPARSAVPAGNAVPAGSVAPTGTLAPLPAPPWAAADSPDDPAAGQHRRN
jgi:hypothetical protein